MAGGATTGGPSTGGPRGPARPSLPSADAALTLPGSCDALLDSYVRRGVERVGPYGWDLPVHATMQSDVRSGGALVDEVAPAPAPGGVVEQGSSGTGTNVQEIGVDEPDVVKTDGGLLVRVRDGELVAYDVTGRVPVEVGDADLPAAGGGAPELLLAGDTLVVVGTTGEEARVITYDLADPGDGDFFDV